ncbi:MAG TPA: hypothetical protein VLH08_02335 [Acidobacteriota bacterium]|nr:hypothetical protein [Acidobacteriota bacterium]
MTEIIPFKKAALIQERETTAAEIISKSRWQITGALVISLVIHFLFFGDYYLTYDDAYVFHVYARNLAQGHGFSFNPGEISHAATPLLTFILAAQHFLFQESALVTAKFVNLGFGLASTVLIFLVAYRITSNTFIAFASSLVWAASPLESILSAGPQDFTLFTFLLLLSLYFYLFHPRSIWTYVFLGFTTLARYEGALYALLLYLNHLYMDYRNDEFSWKNALVRLLVLSAFPAIWFVYIGTHASLLPTSGSAKLNPWALRKVPHFIGGILILFFPILIMAATAAGLAQIRERAPKYMFLFIWVTFCMFFYGPFLDNRRYYVHLLPFIGLFSLVYLKMVAEKYFSSPRWSQIFLYGTIGVCFFAYFLLNIYYYDQTRSGQKLTAYPAYRDAGLWLKNNTSRDASFASEEIGVIPYFAERRLVDFSGWVDLKSKQYREKGDGINEKMLDFLSTRKPEYLIINTDIVTARRQQLLAQDTRFKLEHQIPLLGTEHVLIYSCRW